MRYGWLALIAVAGCGWDEEKYIEKYVTAECEYAFGCYTDAQIEFYGWTDVDDCIATRGSEVTGASEGCVYDKKVAKDCVKAFEDLACADGEDPGANLPAICATVFTCEDDGGGDTNGDTDT
jgi:hypothetical protein